MKPEQDDDYWCDGCQTYIKEDETRIYMEENSWNDQDKHLYEVKRCILCGSSELIEVLNA